MGNNIYGRIDWLSAVVAYMNVCGFFFLLPLASGLNPNGCKYCIISERQPLDVHKKSTTSTFCAMFSSIQCGIQWERTKYRMTSFKLKFFEIINNIDDVQYWDEHWIINPMFFKCGQPRLLSMQIGLIEFFCILHNIMFGTMWCAYIAHHTIQAENMLLYLEYHLRNDIPNLRPIKTCVPYVCVCACVLMCFTKTWKKYARLRF